MWPGRSDGVDLSQPGLGCYLERSWRGGRAASLGHLMLDEKPLGAVLMLSLILVCVLPKRAPAAFSEKPGPLHFLGCPRTGDRCVPWRREGPGGHTKGQSTIMGQNHPGHLLRSQSSGLPESEGRAGLGLQVPRVRMTLEPLELGSRDWAQQGGRGSKGHPGAAERVPLS